MARSVKFEVFGQEYSLNTEMEDAEVQEVLDFVRVHLSETCRATNVLPSSRNLILASLNMAGKYVQLRKDFEAYRNKIDRLNDQIRKKIEDFV
ncbi:MAG: cell division protein ZapA [Proteobacteria bacterium]|nr:cell division protein ZapA [Pseudomonadota bacterium]MBU1737818.1 cell division protein ZapA [Pseudomonadota bacterium]